MERGGAGSVGEMMTSGASGRIIPVCRNISRSVLSRRSLQRILLFLQSFFLWFLLLLQLTRRPLFSRAAGSPPPASSSSPLSSPRKRGGFRRWRREEEEDALRRRILAEDLKMLPPLDAGAETCAWETWLHSGPRRNALFCRSWVPKKGDMKFRRTWFLLLTCPIRESAKEVLEAHFSKAEPSWRVLIGRYAQFAMQLTGRKFGVYAMDWIGHGGSDGLHGYVPSLDHVVADTGSFLDKIKSQNPDIPCFLFGHSTGGAVVLKAASHPHIASMLEGIILTSPALRVKPAHPIVGAIAPVVSVVAPKFQFKGANKRGIPVSRDPAAMQAKYSDPLVYTGPIRVRTGYEILRISSYLMQNLPSVTIPFFVLHGTSDRVTDPLASQDLYHKAASLYKDIKLYEGFLHDLLFEPEREEIGADIIHWMEKRLRQMGYE
ncbi:hypothetical protein Taro_011260 [Colocasia esculenta]|uniref:Serine aminopeptidase S33 domain-containing protein n=1 Tax=Colocasia esculenta TaxID=4460 RepID=A0A843U9D9_COLES|nr:hypothetical protein [Colocasia esculenta]